MGNIENENGTNNDVYAGLSNVDKLILTHANIDTLRMLLAAEYRRANGELSLADMIVINDAEPEKLRLLLAEEFRSHPIRSRSLQDA